MTVVVSEERGDAERRLRDELEILDFSVNTRAGGKNEVDRALLESEVDAVVWLEDARGARVFFKEGGEVEETKLEVDREASSDVLALRAAELVRARLLHGKGREPEAPAPRTAPDRFVLSLEPTLLISSEVVTLQGALAAAWFPTGRLGLGPYLGLPLTAGSVDTTALTRRTWSAGVRLRYVVVAAEGSPFRLEAYGAALARGFAFDVSRGAAAGARAAEAIGPAGALGVACSVRLTERLRLTWGTAVLGGAPLAFEISEEINVPKKESDYLTSAETERAFSVELENFVGVAAGW